MATIPEESVRAYRQAQDNLKRWQTLASSLPRTGPGSKLHRFVERSVVLAEKEYRAAERRLFDVFDIATSDLLTDADLMPDEHRDYLIERAEFHAQRARDDPDIDHADMHRRIARQLSAFLDQLGDHNAETHPEAS